MTSILTVIENPHERRLEKEKEINLLLLRSPGILGNTVAEAVLEFSVDGLEVSHAAGSGGLSSKCLLAPVDYIAKERLCQSFSVRCTVAYSSE